MNFPSDEAKSQSDMTTSGQLYLGEAILAFLFGVMIGPSRSLQNPQLGQLLKKSGNP